MVRHTKELQPLKICTFNANSLNPKKPEFLNFLTTYKIDVCLVQETFLKPSITFNLPNYTVHRSDRLHNKRGGTAIIIKNHLKHDRLDDPTDTEATLIQLHCTNNNKIVLGSVYQPPSSTIDVNFYNDLFDSDKAVILGGDFNSKHVEWGNQTTNDRGKILNTISERLHCQIIAPLEPTHYSPHTQSPDFLDFFILKNVRAQHGVEVLHELDSDHLPVVLSLDDAFGVSSERMEKKKILNIKKFKESLDTHPPSHANLTTPNDIDNAILSLTSSIIAASTSSTFSPSPDYAKHLNQLPAEITGLIREKNKLLRWARVTLDPNIKREANRLTQRIKYLIKDLNDTKWQNKVASLDTGDNSLWRMTRALTSEKRAGIPPIHRPGGVATTDSEKAEIFADSLQEQFTINNTGLITDTHKINSAAHTLLTQTSTDTLTPVSTETVKTIIRGLSTRKAPGPDEVTNLMIKNLTDQKIIELTRIFNRCLHLSYFPLSWKSANVILIHKPGKSRRDVTSYRPISLLSNLGKILETILLQKLHTLIDSKNLLPPEQFGFRSKHSTVHQTTRLVEHITSSFNSRQRTGAVFLDVSKAFDKVWHNGLLIKLFQQDLPLPMIQMTNSFLTNRTFRVKINSDLSTPRLATAGVPQGSPLSPALFNLYTADIPKNPHTQTYLYADDTAITCSHKNPRVIIGRLQKHLQDLLVWSSYWKIQLNPAKTKAIMFDPKNSRIPPEILMNNIPLPWNKSVKYLGLLYDKRLVWKDHFKATIQKCRAARAKLYPLLNVNSKLNLRTKLLIYNQILKPAITYGAPSWAHAPKQNLKILQTFQNTTLRIITGAPWYVRNDQLHKDLEIPTITTTVTRLKDSFFLDIDTHTNRLISHTFSYTPNPTDQFPLPKAATAAQ